MSTADIVKTYFDAWQVNDFDTMRSLVAEDVSFVGPLAETHGVDDYMKGIEGLSQLKTDLVIRKRFVDGEDALTWFELHTPVASPAQVANWMHVEHGKINRVRVTFDPRELIAAQR